MKRLLGGIAAFLIVAGVASGACAARVEDDLVRMEGAFCNAGNGEAGFALAAAEREGFGPARPADSDLLIPIEGVTSPQVRVKPVGALRFAVFTGNMGTNSGPTQVCLVIVFPHT